MLLHAVIDRVVILPRAEGEWHPGAAGRRLRIEWKDVPTPVTAPDFNRHTQSTTRGAAFHREQVTEIRAEKVTAAKEHARRSRAAHASWRKVREERLVDAGLPAAVGPADVPGAVGPPLAAATSPENDQEA